MSVKVKIDLSGVTKKIENNALRGKEVLGESVIKDTDPLVPRDTGELAGSVTLRGDEIVYTADHAKAVYYNPSNEGSHWVEKSKSRNMKKWLSEVERGMK